MVRLSPHEVWHQLSIPVKRYGLNLAAEPRAHTTWIFALVRLLPMVMLLFGSVKRAKRKWRLLASILRGTKRHIFWDI